MAISVGKIVRVIALAREDATRGLHGYIAGMNAEEQADLVALMWVGRESFSAGEWHEAVETAVMEKTAPTEDYLISEPLLADYLEDGMDAMGLDVAEEESTL